MRTWIFKYLRCICIRITPALQKRPTKCVKIDGLFMRLRVARERERVSRRGRRKEKGREEFSMVRFGDERARTRISISIRLQIRIIRMRRITRAGSTSLICVRYSSNLRNSMKEKVVALMYTWKCVCARARAWFERTHLQNNIWRSDCGAYPWKSNATWIFGVSRYYLALSPGPALLILRNWCYYFCRRFNSRKSNAL